MTSDESRKCSDANSNVISTILLVVLTVILAAVLCSIALGFFADYSAGDADANENIKIINVIPPESTGVWCVILENVGDDNIPNRDYNATVYINGIRKRGVVIETLNAHDFIPTHHYGVQRIRGSGAVNDNWNKKETIVFLIANKEIHYGDLLKIEIYNKLNSTLYSVSEYQIPNK